MDLRMPVMDGFEAARRIRGLDGGLEVKIAAVTASVFAGERSEVLAVGFDDFVRKPYRPGEIFDCLARHLGVRYQRAKTASAIPGELRPEELAALPQDLRKDLAKAVISLDGALIASVIQRVSERNATLGEALTQHADRFAYTAIRKAVESSLSAADGS
jgi:CheY-like chemotaxis protein